MKDIEKEIIDIKKRNVRVELDKKWETCWTRRILIGIFTYTVIVVFLYFVGQFDNYFLTALVPVIGFFLSTASLKFARIIWEKVIRD
jgi:hypothetical protein